MQITRTDVRASADVLLTKKKKRVLKNCDEYPNVGDFSLCFKELFRKSMNQNLTCMPEELKVL
jgi:hypothetical protein